MKTIVFRATFEEKTKISAIVGEEKELYTLLNDQCYTLFNPDHHGFAFHVNSPQGKPVLTNSDILDGVAGLHFPILNLFLSRRDLIEEEEVKMCSSTVLCEPCGFSSDTLPPVVIAEVQSTPNQKELKDQKKQQRMEMKMKKREDKVKRRAEKKETKKGKQSEHLQPVLQKETTVENVCVSAPVYEEKVTLKDIEDREKQLKSMLKQVKQEKKVLKKREVIEKKEAKQQERDERKSKKLALKNLENTFSPEIFKTVFVRKDHLLFQKTFKQLMKKGGSMQTVEQVLTAMNSAFELRMQSTAPDHRVVYCGANESVANIIEAANHTKNVNELDSCLFVCSGYEFKALKKLGATVVQPKKWVKIVTTHLLAK